MTYESNVPRIDWSVNDKDTVNIFSIITE